MNEMIFPSCSEIIWRLNIDKSTKEKIMDELDENKKETCETDTATFPNSCLDNIIMLFEEAKEDGKNINNIELEYIDNLGGGGNWEFVEECFEIAKKYSKGEITRKQAEELEKKIWGLEEDE